jgi:hypothetical protein
MVYEITIGMEVKKLILETPYGIPFGQTMYVIEGFFSALCTN